MNDARTAGCATYDTGVGMEAAGRATILRLKSIPWMRVVVDTLIIVGIVLASSSLLTVR